MIKLGIIQRNRSGWQCFYPIFPPLQSHNLYSSCKPERPFRILFFKIIFVRVLFIPFFNNQELCMSVEFIFRILGMIVFSVLGIYWGTIIGRLAQPQDPGGFGFTVEQYAFIMGLVGALIGLVLTPFITTRPIKALKNAITRISAQQLLAALLGLIVGLAMAVLLAFPLSLLPPPFGRVLPFFIAVLFSYFGISVFMMRQDDLFNFLRSISNRAQPAAESGGSTGWAEGRTVLLDTSVIIDGRIADIAHTGFLPGSLLVPRFVLNELQFIADSSDSIRRQRGRRGMEVLTQLQKDPAMRVRITDIDVEGVREVDDKLVILARQMRCPILTNDYNLNRIAELQGVLILNVNELANAVKTVLLPGELLNIRVIQEGKEQGQGVGYMDDGTMVVVENGRDYLDKQINVVVTKVLQTAAGRMIFARPEER